MQVPTNFKLLNFPNTPNYYLACPKDYCSEVPARISPVFPISKEKLFVSWQQFIAKQQRLTVINQQSDADHYTYIQRSKWFRFPDYIDVELIAITADTSSIAIYSRSKYGYSDFGVNEKRVNRWLDEFSTMIMKR